jgi:hypothetical protein
MQIFTWIFIGWMWSRWLQSIFHLTESRREVLGVKEEKQCTNNSDDCDTFSWSVGERDERFEWLRRCEGLSIKGKGFWGLLTMRNSNKWGERYSFWTLTRDSPCFQQTKAFRKLRCLFHSPEISTILLTSKLCCQLKRRLVYNASAIYRKPLFFHVIINKAKLSPDSNEIVK